MKRAPFAAHTLGLCRLNDAFIQSPFGRLCRPEGPPLGDHATRWCVAQIEGMLTAQLGADRVDTLSKEWIDLLHVIRSFDGVEDRCMVSASKLRTDMRE